MVGLVGWAGKAERASEHIGEWQCVSAPAPSSCRLSEPLTLNTRRRPEESNRRRPGAPLAASTRVTANENGSDTWSKANWRGPGGGGAPARAGGRRSARRQALAAAAVAAAAAAAGHSSGDSSGSRPHQSVPPRLTREQGARSEQGARHLPPPAGRVGIQQPHAGNVCSKGAAQCGGQCSGSSGGQPHSCVEHRSAGLLRAAGQRQQWRAATQLH